MSAEAITAPCAFVDSWAAVLIGLLAGVLMQYSTELMDRRWIDDPVGAVSVHGVCGAFGVLALGVFANGRYGTGWNSVDGPVKGLFSGDPAQLTVQFVGVVVCVGVVSAVSFAVFRSIQYFVGFRSLEQNEDVGLDKAELGVEAYEKL